MGGYRKQIATAAMVVALAVVTNKSLVFVLEILLAAWFGTTFIKDAYLVALVIPNLIFIVGIETITVTCVPLFMRLLSRESSEETWSIVSSIVNVTLLSSGGICVIYVLLAPWVISLIAPGFSQQNLALATKLTRIISPIIIWGGLMGFLVGILYSYKRFTLAAFRLTFYNLIVIGFVYLFRSRWGIISLALAVTGASFFQVVVLLLGLRKTKSYYRVSIDIKHPHLKGMAMAMTLVILGVTLTQLNFLIERAMASGLAEGSISSLDFAYKLMRMPFEVFAVAIATVVFPNITGLVISEDASKLREVFTSALRMTAFITIPATVILIALGSPLIRILFERGEFGVSSTRMTATALFYYSFGLLFHGVNYVIIRTYYAFKDYKTPLKMGLIAIGLYILFNLVLVRRLAHGGLALGCSLAAMCYTVMLLKNLKIKMKGLRVIIFLKPLVKIVAGSALMGVVFIFMGRVPIYSPILRFMLVLGAGGLTYFAVCFFLKVQEASQILKTSTEFIRGTGILKFVR